MTPPGLTHDTPPAPAEPPPGRRKCMDAIAAFELRYMRVLQANLAILRRRQLDERRRRRLERLANLWPLWLGLGLGVLAPQIETLARSYGPWGMNLLFPFVELASRPEILFGPVTRLLPSIMLFAQFPLEGLVAWAMLRRGINSRHVLADIAIAHCFGILDLWLLSAGPAAILIH